MTNDDISASVASVSTTATNENELHTFNYFPTPVYTLKNSAFLTTVSDVADEYLKKAHRERPTLNEIYPLYQTDSMLDDARLYDFVKYISQLGWDILNSQGYDMNQFNTYLNALWCQEHHRRSNMEYHVHGYGEQLVGFYFLNSPTDTRVIFHDPKPGKVQISLPETDSTMATHASNMINFTPEPGMIMITNAWLAHSFTRNISTTPFKFMHFNIIVSPAQNVCATSNANATPYQTPEII